MVSVIKGSSYLTHIFLSEHFSKHFNFQFEWFKYDALKAGWNVMIESWTLLLRGHELNNSTPQLGLQMMSPVQDDSALQPRYVVSIVNGNTSSSHL